MAAPATLDQDGTLKAVVAHAKEYGFIFPSSEIYDGLQAVYDYGSYGAELKKNVKEAWWRAMTQLHPEIVGLDAAILMHPTTWKASGHVDAFHDPMIDNKDSKKRYRADVLIEEKADRLEAEGDKAAADALLTRMSKLLEAEDLEGVRQLIIDEGIKCPVSGTQNWTEVRQFNLMFSTKIGSLADDSATVYLRPETAQGIFVNFLNVQKSARRKIPFGIAQIGKAFRNEIVARGFTFRMREFEQMEMQYFVRPNTEMDHYATWKESRMKWHKAIGLPAEKLRFHDHEKLAHYANAAVDVEYKFPWGFKEIEGIHSRTDFDLKSHQEFSKKKQQYFDEEIKENYIPYVVETSAGCDRVILALLCEGYNVEEAKEEDKRAARVWLSLHPVLAPVKLAILPLLRKEGQPEFAKELYDELYLHFPTAYEESGAIGKRYVRQDFVGTPFCVTVDHQSLEDGTVTLRHRDSAEQERIPKEEVRARVEAACSWAGFLQGLK